MLKSNNFLTQPPTTPSTAQPNDADVKDPGSNEAGSGSDVQPRGQYLLLSHASSEAGGGGKKRLARQRMVNGSIDHGLISDSHAQRKAMFLKQHKVASRYLSQALFFDDFFVGFGPLLQASTMS